MDNQSNIDLGLDADPISPSLYYTFVKGVVALRVCICLGGFLGNGINIRAFLRIGLEDSVTIAFYTLAISDLVYLLAISVTTIATLCESFERDLNVVFPLRPFYVKLVVLVCGRTFHYISMLMAVFLAIQRCLCVAIPFRFKGVFTRCRTWLIILIIWSYGFSWPVMVLSHYRFRKEHVQATNSSIIILIRKPAIRYFLTYGYIANGTVLTFSSQILLLVCVIIMTYVLKKSVRFRHTSMRSGVLTSRREAQQGVGEKKTAENDVSAKVKMSNSKERQVIVQVILVSAIFLLASLPYNMLSIAGFIVPDLGVYKKYHYTFATLYDVKVTLEIVNAAVNVFVYYKYNAKFRQVCFRQKLKK